MFWFSFTSLRSGPAPIDWRIKLAAAKLVNKVDHLAAKESVTIPFCANGQYITGSHFGPDCGAACFQVKGRFLKKHSKTQSINMEWLVTKTAPELFREEVNDGSFYPHISCRNVQLGQQNSVGPASSDHSIISLSVIWWRSYSEVHEVKQCRFVSSCVS